MNSQTKTIIIIVVIFLLVLAGLFFAYQLFVGENGIGDYRDTTTGVNGRDSLFPDSGSSSDTRSSDSTGEDNIIPILRQISSSPSSGGIAFNDGEDVVIRYVERATGHIFETNRDSLEQNRISNTTIPRVQESVWSPNGEMVILRYLDESETLKSFYGKVLKEAGVLEGWFLSNNITDIDVHEDGDIFYIRKTDNSAKGIVANFDGTNSKTVFSSTIYDWYPQWSGDSVTVTTKPARDISGFVYLLKSGNLEKILSSSGLIVNINPDGSKILLSLSNSDETNLFVYDLRNKNATEVSFRTLAEKCTWSNNSTLFCASPYNSITGVVPDDWYKGSLSFSDDIWSYDTETETARLIFDAEANNNVFDAINLTVDSNEKTLLFTNKSDLILWALSLE